MSKQVHILLTGGHAATTALAVIEELKKDTQFDWKISWVGTKKAFEGTENLPFEQSLFPNLGVNVYSVSAAKLQSKFTRNTIPALLRLPLTFIQAFFVFRKVKPNIILAFGGSAALPISIYGLLFGIPVIVHEQTSAAGLSNKVVSNFAKKVALSRESSRDFYKENKCELTGNPLTNSILELAKLENRGKKLFIMGGSRGSQRINEAIFGSLENLLHKFEIIHQTGELDYEKAQKVKSKLPLNLQKKYQPFAFISPLDMGSMYLEAGILVARSGANTVSEVLALGIPTIFIPIPWTRMNEQRANAEFAANLGIARILDQEMLTPEKIKSEIINIAKDCPKIRSLYKKNEFNLDLKARGKIVSLLKSYI